MSSLRRMAERGYGLPYRYIMQPEPEMPEQYVVEGRMMGMEWMKGNSQKNIL